MIVASIAYTATMEQRDDDARGDSVLRALTDDGGFRVITARTDATAQAAIAAQGVAGATARLFAELLTGAVLYRETMAPNLRVQCILDRDGDAGANRMVADSFPDGGNRGMVSLDEPDGDFALGPGALLRMQRALPRGRVDQGVVAVPPDGGLSAALMTYMQESEQVLTMLAVGAVDDDDGLRAGGYLVQLLPEAERGVLAVMTERLAAFDGIDALLAADASPDELLQSLLFRIPFTRLAASDVRYACPCSRERFAEALRTAARSEVTAALADGRRLETRCEFCRTSYRFDLDELAQLARLPASASAETVH